MYSNSMQPLILRPTRIGNTSATLIDHIWSNCSNENVSSGIMSCDVSDHFIVYAATGARAVVPNDRYVTVSKRLISDASNENFSNELNSANFDFLNDITNTNEMYNAFIALISSLYNKHFPIITKCVKVLDYKKPYITSEIKNLIRDKRNLYKKFRKRPITFGDQYRSLKNYLDRKIKRANKDYYANKLNSCDGPKDYLDILKSILGSKSQASHCKQLLLIDASITRDTDVIAEHFNNYFSSIGQALYSNIATYIDFEQFLPPIRCNYFTEFEPTTTEEIYSIMKDFDDYSKVSDDLYAFIFKRNYDILGDNITRICNISLSTGVFPDALMLAKLISLFKSNDPDVDRNYRPISLLNFF